VCTHSSRSSGVDATSVIRSVPRPARGWGTDGWTAERSARGGIAQQQRFAQLGRARAARWGCKLIRARVAYIMHANTCRPVLPDCRRERPQGTSTLAAQLSFGNPSRNYGVSIPSFHVLVIGKDECRQHDGGVGYLRGRQRRGLRRGAVLRRE
jgi:hypothetical protein